MNNLVSIHDFNPIGQDERGSTSDFSLSRKQNEFIFLTRKSGSISGNTYHEGKNTGTNPKTFLLLSGRVKLSYRKIGDHHKYEKIIEKPCIIEISPMVTHKMEVLADITILECNSIKDIKDDRQKENV